MTGAPARIPATVITGFLGAGKTSTIRHLLARADRRIALVINEFGDLGVDGEIVRGCGVEGCADGDVVELANGCICCTVADDFLPTMQAILARPERPEHIVIETSGLALPKPLVRAFGWPEVRTQVTVDGVIALVDGPAVLEGLFAADPGAVQAQREADAMLDHESPLEELFEEQLACADMVVVNKCDLLDERQREALDARLEGRLRAGARVVRASHGAIDPAVLLGLDAAAEDDLDTRPSHHDDAGDHEHDDFESFVVELCEQPDPQRLLERIGAAVRAFGILRVKGFAAVAGKDMRLVVQGVGPRLQHYFDRDWGSDEPRRTRLVVIGRQGLDAEGVRVSLAG